MMNSRKTSAWIFAFLAMMVSMLVSTVPAVAADQRVKVLLLGDRAQTHRPPAFFEVIQGPLGKKGIDLTFADNVNVLNAENLAQYDCLMLFLNTNNLPADNEKAMIDFVESGKGLVAVHCASAAFGNSTKFTALVGGKFQSHNTGVFRPLIIDAQHPAMAGFKGFEVWDETYVHSNLSNDRRVLMMRVNPDGTWEPWTWTRKQGKGKVFYTASGHDERAWNDPGYQDLLVRGVMFASGKLGDDDLAIPTERITIPLEYTQSRTTPEVKELQIELSPQESLKRMHTPGGLHVELAASEPEIIKVVSMCFDEKGRAWVVETVDYPHTILNPGIPGHDRIKILEDTNGDGKLDKVTVFAEGLNLPQGMILANGGAIVAQTPDILFLKDTDGDGKADTRKVLFTGFNRNDTHAMVGNFTYGLDNWIWACCGYSGGSIRGEGTGAQVSRVNQTLFRFKADGSAFEVITATSNNTWGVGVRSDNEIFYSTANGEHSSFMAVPNRYLESIRGLPSQRGNEKIEDHRNAHPYTDMRQVDNGGGYTAASGSTSYTARAFPSMYWEKAQFVTEPTAHLVHMDIVTKKGSGYTSRDGFNILVSSDTRFAPIQSLVGPDGALWVVDWYSYVVQHNPIPQGYRNGGGGAYLTPLRDKDHARIYRVVADDYKPAPYPKLSMNDPAGLVAQLSNDNMFWRSQAQRLLVERANKDVAADLIKAAGVDSVDTTGENFGVVHALWTMQGLNLMDGANAQAMAVAVKDLRHKSPAVRRAAAQVLPSSADSAKALVASGLLQDPDLAVRRSALLVMADMPALPGGGEAVLKSINNPQAAGDYWLGVAGAAAAAKNDVEFLMAVMSAPELQAPAAPPAPAGTGGRRGGGGGGGRGGAPGAAPGAPAGRGGAPAAPGTPAPGGALPSGLDADGTMFVGAPAGAGAASAAGAGGGRGGRAGRGPGAGGAPAQPAAPAGPAAPLSVRRAGTGNQGGSLDPIRAVATHYARGGNADALPKLLESMKTAKADVANAILDGLIAGWPNNAQPGNAKAIADAFADAMSKSPSLTQQLSRLAQRLGVKSAEIEANLANAIKTLTDQLNDRAAAPAVKMTAATQLMEMADNATTVTAIAKSIQPQSTQDYARAMIDAIGRSKLDQAGGILLERWTSIAPSARQDTLAVLLRRPAWTGALLSAMDSGTVDKTDLSPAHVQSLNGITDEALAARVKSVLSKKGLTVNEDRQKVIDAFMATTTKKGDITRGQEVFTKNCAVCHTFDGKGGNVGPDLTGILKGDKHEILINILDPSRSVEGNFRMWNVATKSGESISGLLKSETTTAFEIVDAQAKTHSILRDDVRQMAMDKISLMPTGIESVGQDAIADLLEFLAQPKTVK